MQVKFTHALRIGGHLFSVGVHEVPDALLEANEAVFERYVKIGWIVDPKETDLARHETLAERHKRIAAKLAAEQDERMEKPLVEPEAPAAPVDAPPAAPTEPEAPAAPEEPQAPEKPAEDVKTNKARKTKG